MSKLSRKKEKLTDRPHHQWEQSHNFDVEDFLVHINLFHQQQNGISKQDPIDSTQKTIDCQVVVLFDKIVIEKTQTRRLIILIQANADIVDAFSIKAVHSTRTIHPFFVLELFFVSSSWVLIPKISFCFFFFFDLKSNVWVFFF